MKLAGAFLVDKKEVIIILKSCRYCGKIHKSDYTCSKVPQRKKYSTEQNSFRNTSLWAKKRKQIKERDKYLCQICLEELYDAANKYNYTDIEVHHIIPLAENYDLRLEDSNLICLCAFHHHLADRNKIPKSLLNEIADRNIQR
ncbi:MAG: HNH endonuclease signature motif containing protein [Oscillospiraceae bacterium]